MVPHERFLTHDALLVRGRYSPNLLAATIAVVLGCTVHYCKEHGGAGNDNTSDARMAKGSTHDFPTPNLLRG